MTDLTLKRPKKLLYTIKNFSYIVGCKINFQILVAFLYTNSEQTEIEYRKTILLTIALTTTTYLGIKLTKDVKDLYKEIYKPSKKEIKEGYRRWKDLSCSRIGRINIEKMAILPKAIYMFKEFPPKFQRHSSQRLKNQL
jgi:hypothetical protein